MHPQFYYFFRSLVEDFHPEQTISTKQLLENIKRVEFFLGNEETPLLVQTKESIVVYHNFGYLNRLHQSHRGESKTGAYLSDNYIIAGIDNESKLDYIPRLNQSRHLLNNTNFTCFPFCHFSMQYKWMNNFFQNHDVREYRYAFYTIDGEWIEVCAWYMLSIP